MSTASTLSASHSDAAFYRKRQAMLIFPLIVLPFIAVLFWLFKGGKGERYTAEEAAAGKPGAGGFNASVPTAKNGSINGREVDGPGYGKAKVGQVLSVFGNTRQDSIAKGLKAIPAVEQATQASQQHASSLGATSVGATALTTPDRIGTNPPPSNANAVAAATRRPKGGKPYRYQAPQARPYYTASVSDQQLESQLRDYQTARSTTPRYDAGPGRAETVTAPPTQLPAQSEVRPATVQVSDNLTATRLDEPTNPEDAFHTAPTEGSRRRSQRAVLSSGNSYGSRKTVAWMIPVVVHEDQAIREGQQVKLRLTKEITADGITIPANTILYAVCNLADDRLRLSVRSLQLGGQLIPLDLDVYDTDGSPGINVPGLSTSSQVGGQMRSSAIQGVPVPGVGGLANTVLSTARMGVSNAARQATIRLRAGYNLFLKAQ